MTRALRGVSSSGVPHSSHRPAARASSLSKSSQVIPYFWKWLQVFPGVAWRVSVRLLGTGEISAVMSMRIAFAVRVHNARWRSAVTQSCATMCDMDLDELDERIVAATKRRIRAENAFHAADAELRELLIEGRAAGKGPSHMAKLTGFTREWVAKIAPGTDSKKRVVRVPRRKPADSDD
ncbi:predicted protein [Streptomyces viridosporus ATCC 14672]|uniref:Predicted protein n=2 Tax=Streptomyces viridosporus TaxID=67581 RepID=D6A4J7_STRV1|nr:predicted protein [Streptomyces viridosporus ATCC 14672]